MPPAVGLLSYNRGLLVYCPFLLGLYTGSCRTVEVFLFVCLLKCFEGFDDFLKPPGAGGFHKYLVTGL